MNQNIATTLIVAGLVLVIFGVVSLGKFGPLGNLPGDIRITRPNFTFYFPLATSILLSAVVTLIFWIIQSRK